MKRNNDNDNDNGDGGDVDGAVDLHLNLILQMINRIDKLTTRQRRSEVNLRKALEEALDCLTRDDLERYQALLDDDTKSPQTAKDPIEQPHKPPTNLKRAERKQGLEGDKREIIKEMPTPKDIKENRKELPKPLVTDLDIDHINQTLTKTPQKRNRRCPNCMCGKMKVGRGKGVSKHRGGCKVFTRYVNWSYCVCGKSLEDIRKELKSQADDVMVIHKRVCNKSKLLLESISRRVEKMQVDYEHSFKKHQEMIKEQNLDVDLFDFGKQGICGLCSKTTRGGFNHLNECSKGEAIRSCFMMALVNHHAKAAHVTPAPFSEDYFYVVLGVPKKMTHQKDNDIWNRLDLNKEPPADLHEINLC
eukprot:TRINITY_DN5631_c0_g1_i2.p1 TRINITY_DN5631_c0_g1~~TRINITY_DN5631_c0_g1_i2.p1  ORF type:complete len:360 (-),score=99.48 TRINITY_DN5631_c0_g1_i2:3-1082(-)